MLNVLLLAGVILASGPSDEMFDELLNAPDAETADPVEADIWASWGESGSPTVDLLMERAANAEQTGETDLALSLYDRAVLVKPDYAEAYHRRAILFLSDDNYAEALRDLNEALSLEPRHFGAWTGLGAILERFGSTSEALAAYREALKIHPNLAQAKQGERRLAAAADGRSL